jgi:hypothetical protein
MVPATCETRSGDAGAQPDEGARSMSFHRPRCLPRVGHLLAALALLLTVSALGAPAPSTAAPSPTDPSPTDPTAATSTERPQRCANRGAYVWSHLEVCGWPGASNTGARPRACPGDSLRDRGRDPRHVIHVKRRGATLSCQRIVGCLSIEAPDVVLKDLAIRCTSGRSGEDANGTAVIDLRPGASATVAHTSINGMRGVHACIWHMGTRLRARAVDCRRVNDGIFSWSDVGTTGQGDHFTIRNSYFHNLTTRTANGHVDGYQTEGAAHGRMVHNTWLITTDADNESNSAIAIWNSRRDSRDILVKHNLIAGGGFAVYAHDDSPSESNPSGGYAVTGVRFVGNVFSRHLFGCVGYYGVWFPRGRPTDGWHRDGNRVLETGANIDRRNPTYRGRVCR